MGVNSNFTTIGGRMHRQVLRHPSARESSGAGVCQGPIVARRNGGGSCVPGRVMKPKEQV